MAAATRQPKPPRKGGMPETTTRRPSAWTGARASPTFSPGVPNTRLPAGQQTPTNGPFPAMGNQNGAPRADRPQDRVLQQLSGLTGTTVTLSTKNGQRYEGVIGSTSGEGDAQGVTLKDVKEISSPGQPLKESLFITSTNIDTWSSGPADAKLTNGDSFKTDVDISKANSLIRERPLQAWADDIPDGATASGTGGRYVNNDDLTFGPGASTGGNQWDQFAANEKLFGVKANFDEEAYTTKLDRNAPDFKEKEKKAQQLAAEIMSGTSANTHIAEERKMDFVGENGTNEEDRYGAVVRSANAYVPPGARKATGGASNTNGGSPAPSATSAKSEIPKVSVNGPDGSGAKEPQKPASPAPTSGAAKPADPLPAFRDFVSNERDRLMKKKQALMKHEMDKRMADLVKFSKSFKLNKPVPEDLVPILAKDEEKQKQIREKSNKDAESSQARTIGPSNLTAATGTPTIQPSATSARIGGTPVVAKVHTAGSPQPGSGSKTPPALIKASSSATPPGKDSAAAKRISMFIQAIPPFKGSGGKRASIAPPGNSSAPSANGAHPPTIRTNSSNNANISTPLSPTAQNRLNVNASSFRPTPKSASTQSSGSPSAKEQQAAAQSSPNPFFGTRTLKKTPPVHIKDDFNPFKYAKVVDASQIAPQWPYNGKRYITMFPPLPTPPQQQSPHLAHPGPPAPMPPPTFEEQSSDPAAQAAQAAARGYVYAYPPYGYPGQPMMPGMPPPHGHMPPYMQPIPYPYMPPPNAMYPGTPMGQMPPPFMPPPGAYPPPPNGAGPRPSMPPTPIPSHAHPYYHQSPQLQHAVPYPMMMPPPGAPVPPHPYEGQPAPPVQMGGVGHA
ncbi:PAB1-binding protein-like protein [Phanerochaete sordida]|uniref:PAB1-binding protein-like protein n=1 Tax=Phanerochaete sordida TaxID=48140 RepID=A0A9P3G706_9APHY|nr:PAB1-binding protein-like protein [Phanerochaete sordida]